MTTPAQEPTTPLRIVFAGTPDFALLHLQALAESPYTIVGAYTQPDRPAGRGKKTRPSPVKDYALQQGIPVYTPHSLKTPEAQAELAALQADIMVVVAYGQLLPQAVLDTPRLGCINVHGSLLPRWRGAAPIERAIEAGDRETGLTIMQMDAGLDTGPMLGTAHCSIDASTTGDQLREQLATLGGPLLLEALNSLASGNCSSEAQDDTLSTYASKLDKSEAWIDWSMNSDQIARKIRAFCSTNVAVTSLGDDRIKLWAAHATPDSCNEQPGKIMHADKHGIQVACGSGTLHITELQLPGRKPMAVAAVLNSRSAMFAPGTQFGG